MVSRAKHRLTSNEVKNAPIGPHHDGGGLLLIVRKTKNDSLSRNWFYRFWDGKDRWAGLGTAATLSLKEAREAADDMRRLRIRGINPIEARRKERAAKPREERSFRACAEEYYEVHQGQWKNSKHKQQWKNTLNAYAYPAFGDQPINAVTCEDLIAVLSPIASAKPETAQRLRARMLKVMNWSVAKGYRTNADNPVTWGPRLETAVPIKSKAKRVRHHPALPYEQVPTFMAKLRAAYSVSARALEFAILTAARTSEVLEAQWSEFDFDKGIWTIPAERMKSGREHRVPLCQRAVEILIEMKASKSRRWVFVGPRKEPLSNMALLMMVRRTTGERLTTHGFRSSFRDWAAEVTPFSREVAEQALAHVIADKTEAAYRRGDMFEKRRQLMDAWAEYCETSSAKRSQQETVQQIAS